MAGVACIQVLLEASSGKLAYDPTVTTPHQVCDAINAIASKFTATPENSGKIGLDLPVGKLSSHVT